jgi:hypothetical protein
MCWISFIFIRLQSVYMFCSSPEKNNLDLYLNWSLYTTIEFRQDKVQKIANIQKVTKHNYIL